MEVDSLLDECSLNKINKTISITTTVFEDNGAENIKYNVFCSDNSFFTINITKNEVEYNDSNYEIDGDSVKLVYDYFSSIPDLNHHKSDNIQTLTIKLNKNVPKELSDYANIYSNNLLSRLLSYPVIYKNQYN